MASPFRKKLASWIAVGLLALAALSLVFADVGGGLGGMGGQAPENGTTLVEVEGEEIQAAELERLIRRQLDQVRQQNPEVDLGRLIAAGAYEGALNQLVVSRAIWAFGEANGLTVSDRMIDRVIANIPEFRNFAGQFDEASFRGVLQQQNLTEAALRREIATFLMQRQVQLPVGLGARVPESVVAQYASLMLERRRGSIGVVPTEAVTQGIAPTPQEVAAFYRQNRARYTIPERRVLRYALVGREQVAAAAQPTDAEIQAFYRENAARFAGQETRTLQQVVLQDEAAARAVVQRAGGGANFAAAAQQAGFSATDIAIGAQSREQYARISNPQIADAVFQAPQGAVVGPLRSGGDWYVLRVESINRSSGRPLEAVRGEIATELGRRKLQEALADLVGRLEEKAEDGASFEEIVRAERLTMVETPPVTATGQAPGTQYQAPAELQALLRGAFNIDPENPEPAVETIAPNERYAFISVARIVPASVPPLEQIADRVRADVVRERGSERARALAERIAARINSGVPAARAFAEAGVRLPAPRPIDERRADIARRGPQVPPPLAMMFAIPQGRARILRAPDGAGWFVVHIAERTAGQVSCPRTPVPAGQQPPEGCQLLQQARAQLSGEAGTEYADQLARAIQQSVAIERKDEAIRSTRQRLQATTVAP
jgi:peptidyl-prolyl cis-trans isomerase D